MNEPVFVPAALNSNLNSSALRGERAGRAQLTSCMQSSGQLSLLRQGLMGASEAVGGDFSQSPGGLGWEL